MTRKRFGVGIVGVEPGRSWAARAHIPALRSLPDRFEIIGVANTSAASSIAAARDLGLPCAFSDVAELIADRRIDIVTVSVKVPAHLEIVKAATAAGKHVYCEWPLGRNLAESEEMAALVRDKGITAVAGIQGKVAPDVDHLRKLISEGFIGEVLSTTLVARSGGPLGARSIPSKRTYGYLLDNANGATLLTIPVGHTLAALTSVLGNVAHVAAVLATREPVISASDTGEALHSSSPDQVLVCGVLASGAPLSLHFRGGAARDGYGLFWEISGTEGDIRISASSGQTQMVKLSLTSARGEETLFQPLDIPTLHHSSNPISVEARNVARVYAMMADDLEYGSRTAPSFDDAVAIHRVVAAIEKAAQSKSWQVL